MGSWRTPTLWLRVALAVLCVPLVLIGVIGSWQFGEDFGLALCVVSLLLTTADALLVRRGARP